MEQKLNFSARSILLLISLLFVQFSYADSPQEPHTSVAVVDCGVIEISTRKQLRRVVYLADGQKTKINGLSGQNFTLEASHVTEVWVNLGRRHRRAEAAMKEPAVLASSRAVGNKKPRGRGIWKHFTVDDSELCAPAVPMCETSSDCSTGNSCLAAGVCSASVSGNVFSDDDSSGLFDSADGFVDAAIVVLEAPAVDGGWQSVASETTDSLGGYRFGEIAPSNDYRLSFQNMLGADPFVFTLQDIGSDDSIDSDVDSQGITETFTLAPDEVVDNIWAGVIPEASRMCMDSADCPNTLSCGEGGICTSILGGRIFVDVNRDGIFNAGDRPSDTVLVRLQIDLSGEGDWVNSAADLSDGSGFYSFTGVTPIFDYRITVEAFPGNPALVFTTANAGTDDTIDSDVDASGASGLVLDGYDVINTTIWAGLLE